MKVKMMKLIGLIKEYCSDCKQKGKYEFAKCGEKCSYNLPIASLKILLKLYDF